MSLTAPRMTGSTRGALAYSAGHADRASGTSGDAVSFADLARGEQLRCHGPLSIADMNFMVLLSSAAPTPDSHSDTSAEYAGTGPSAGLGPASMSAGRDLRIT